MKQGSSGSNSHDSKRKIVTVPGKQKPKKMKTHRVL